MLRFASLGSGNATLVEAGSGAAQLSCVLIDCGGGWRHLPRAASHRATLPPSSSPTSGATTAPTHHALPPLACRCMPAPAPPQRRCAQAALRATSTLPATGSRLKSVRCSCCPSPYRTTPESRCKCAAATARGTSHCSLTAVTYEGCAVGEARGKAESKAEGKAEGLLEGSRCAARQMLAMGGFTLEKIAAITSLSENEVRMLAAEAR